MKHILRNSLLLLSAAALTLVGCNKAELESLRSEVDSLNSTIDSLNARIDAANVTLTCIPDYKDGSVGVQFTREGLKISGAATLNFAVQPASAAEKIAKDWETALSTDAVSTLTFIKATGGNSVEMPIKEAWAKDGVLSITVDAQNLGKDFIRSRSGASLSLKVSCGDIQIASSYISLVPVMETEEEFISYLLANFDTDGDGQPEPDQMSALTSLDISFMDIYSLDGVLDQMPALTTLNCSNNELTSIDLSKNEKLTDVNLTGNDNLTKVVCKSLDWAMSCSCLLSDDSALYYLSDGTQITLDTSLSVEIAGYTWKQFNAGARLGNLYGSLYTFEGAKTACPSGWKVPTHEELGTIDDARGSISDWTTYLGMNGYWFAGNKAYSSTASSIFLPVLSPGSSEGRYWTSSKDGGGNIGWMKLDSERAISGWGANALSEWSVRCVKEN